LCCRCFCCFQYGGANGKNPFKHRQLGTSFFVAFGKNNRIKWMDFISPKIPSLLYFSRLKWGEKAVPSPFVPIPDKNVPENVPEEPNVIPRVPMPMPMLILFGFGTFGSPFLFHSPTSFSPNPIQTFTHNSHDISSPH
jgi:hypothetical protein